MYKYESISKMPAKLKIEVNTTERLQVLPLKTAHAVLESDRAKGNADIINYKLDELMATKLARFISAPKGSRPI